MIKVVTDLIKYELDIRAVINLFYQNEKVYFNKDNGEEYDFLIEISVDDKKVLVTIVSDAIKETVTENLSDDFRTNTCEDQLLLRNREKKNKVKLGLYKGLSTITGHSSKWGTLTGVRPTKLIFMAKKEGMNKEQILRQFMDHYLCEESKTRLILEIAEYEYDKVEEYIDEDNYSLYVGIPFCPTTCLYCSFASNPVGGNEQIIEEYLKALYKEIEITAEFMKGKKLISLYIGGGTPTALNAKQLEELLNKIKTEFNYEAKNEYTVEAGRPDSITLDKLKVLKKYGVNRISINPQVMDDDILKVIGRHHRVLDIIDSFNMARSIGFDNINMDIIMGLPKQNMLAAEKTIKDIMNLNPESITVHTLALKKNSALTLALSEYENMLDEDVQSMTDMAFKELRYDGYTPYYLYRQKNIASHLENIGYAKRGYECIYNILMMEEMQTIVACGAGTISKKVGNPRLIIEGKPGIMPSIERYDNPRNLKDYIQRIDEITDKKRHFFNSESKD
ncbi:MAG: coproporphyrinogen dehydrogenase HemZ [Lachnospiraceae bacterium]|nr:coproporphyrinogen dehydrogenase HemZ [Lachnospiraceae bacterium]